MIREDFLQLLRCPLNHGPLANAEADLVEQLNSGIQAGQIKNRAGDAVNERLDGGLVDEGRTLVYPIHDDIPCLLVDEAIPLNQLQEQPHGTEEESNSGTQE